MELHKEKWLNQKRKCEMFAMYLCLFDMDNLLSLYTLNYTQAEVKHIFILIISK